MQFLSVAFLAGKVAHANNDLQRLSFRGSIIIENCFLLFINHWQIFKVVVVIKQVTIATGQLVKSNLI